MGVRIADLDRQNGSSHKYDSEISELRAHIEELKRHNEELVRQNGGSKKVVIPGRQTLVDGKKVMDLTNFRPESKGQPVQRRQHDSIASEWVDLTGVNSDGEER